MLENIHLWQNTFLTSDVVICAKAVADYTQQLTASELGLVKSSVDVRKNTYSTGRYCAKTALNQIGVVPDHYVNGLLRQPDGSVAWPSAAIGSISHTNDWAVAAVAKSNGALVSLGVDVELIDRVDKGVLRLIATDEEREQLDAMVELRWGRVALFSIKESLYKCLRPIFGEYIRFKDVQITNLTHVAPSIDQAEITKHGIEVYCPSVKLILPSLSACCDAQRIQIRFVVLPKHVFSFVSYQS